MKAGAPSGKGARELAGQRRSAKRAGGNRRRDRHLASVPPSTPKTSRRIMTEAASIDACESETHTTNPRLRPELERFASELADLLVEDLVRFPRQK
jgi:hypothetical protein